MSYIGKQPIRTALTSSDIEDGVITAAKIEDGAVVAAEIASNAVTTAKINADAVTSAKIADDSVNSEHLAAAGIDKEHLTDHLDIFAGTSLSAADLGAGVHIKTADSGASVNAGHDEIVAEGSGNSGISILSGTSSNGAVCFGDSGNNCIGYVNYDHTNNKLDLGTNGATQFSLDSSGNFLPAATDHGIYLGVTSATASNLLNDYEEGTFTPDTNIGFASVVGEYIKIGKMVHFTIQGTYNAGPGDGSQASSVTGLPFSASPGDQLCEVWVVTHNEHVIGQVGGTGIGLKGRGDGVSITRGQIGNKSLQITGTYHIDL